MRRRGYFYRLKRLFEILNRATVINKRLEDMLPEGKRAAIINKSIINRAGKRVKSVAMNNKSLLRNVNNNIKNIYNNGLNKQVSYKNGGSPTGSGMTAEKYVNSLKNRVINRTAFKGNYSYAYEEGKDNKENTKIKNINKLLSLKSLSHINAANRLRHALILKQEKSKALSLEGVGNPSLAYGRAPGRAPVSSKALNIERVLKNNLYKINLPEIKALSMRNVSAGVYLKSATVEMERASLKSVYTGVSLKTENKRLLLKSATARAPLRQPMAIGTDLKYKIKEGLISPGTETGKRKLDFRYNKQCNKEYNKQDNINESFLSAKNAFNEKTFFNKTTGSEKNNVYLNVKVDFNAYTGSLSTRQEMESFAAVFVRRLEKELNTFAEGVHL